MGCRSHVPGWHERTKALQRANKLQVVGIIEEQHPARCRLFMQWKQMGWPVLVDSLNLLGVTAVPYAYLLDEHGVIRFGERVRVENLTEFLETTYAKPEEAPPPAEFPDPEALEKKAADQKDDSDSDASVWLAYGDALFLRGRDTDLDKSVEAYRKALTLGGPPEASFRLGVALRRRYESAHRRFGDFQAALDAWGKALSQQPNQYIWRRRIQQYGPRLEKPYAFYDWVGAARKDIELRGKTPVPLAVEPRGAEIARPSKKFEAAAQDAKEPDPVGRIQLDTKRLIVVETAVAPAAVQRGGVARIHLVLRPDGNRKAHWNNEAGVTEIWLQPRRGAQVSRKRLSFANARTEVSTEPREVECEVRIPQDVELGKFTVPGYALYYVCEGETGTCIYLRQDVAIEFRVKG